MRWRRNVMNNSSERSSVSAQRSDHAFDAPTLPRSSRSTIHRTMNDLKFAFRQLLKQPGFTAVTVLTMGLGIATVTVVFSLVNTLYFHALSVRELSRLHDLFAVPDPGS